MPRLLTPETHEAVAADGLPRVADYDDGSRHVLYWGGDRVRSLTEAEWLAQRGPLPTDPTPEQSAAAIAARAAAEQQAIQDAAALRQAIRAKLASAEGKRVDDLLVGELRALLAYLLWREGGIDKDLKVKPIGEWGK